MLLMMRMLLEQVCLIRFFMVLTYCKGGKGGEKKDEEHKVHLVDHHLAGEATVQLEPGKK